MKGGCSPSERNDGAIDLNIVHATIYSTKPMLRNTAVHRLSVAPEVPKKESEPTSCRLINL